MLSSSGAGGWVDVHSGRRCPREPPAARGSAHPGASRTASAASLGSSSSNSIIMIIIIITIISLHIINYINVIISSITMIRLLLLYLFSVIMRTTSARAPSEETSTINKLRLYCFCVLDSTILNCISNKYHVRLWQNVIKFCNYNIILLVLSMF